MGTLIALDGVSRTFSSDPPVHALRDVTLHVSVGESIAIVGPSGSGKSTMLHIIGCLDRATTGSYWLDGVDTASLRDRELAKLRGRSIGFVFQAFHLLSYRSALDNVMLAEVYLRRPQAGRRNRAHIALERVGLGHRANHFPTMMSGGERQRVAIARAIVAQPPLLLCDEPTGNLDSVNTSSVLVLLDELRRDGLTVVLITHDPMVADHAERVVRIVDGSLSEQSSSQRSQILS